MLLRGPLLASAPLESVHADMPRYEVCVVTQVKPFARLLPAWVEYHARLGVDHFYILDNGAPDDIGAILGERRNVEIVEWLWEKTQVQALSYVLHAARGRCEWLMAIDVDEYVLVGGVGTGDARADERLLKRYVRMRAHAVEITLHYVTMASRIPARTSDNPAKDYTFLAERQVRGKGKSLCKTEYEWLRAGVHFCAPVREMMADCKKRRVDVVGMEPRRVEDAGVVVHFKYRSAEEMKEKVRVGSGSTADVKNLVREVGKVPKVRRVGREWSFFKEFYARVVAGGVGGVCVKWVNGGKVESFYAKG